MSEIQIWPGWLPRLTPEARTAGLSCTSGLAARVALPAFTLLIMGSAGAWLAHAHRPDQGRASALYDIAGAYPHATCRDASAGPPGNPGGSDSPNRDKGKWASHPPERIKAQPAVMNHGG